MRPIRPFGDSKEELSVERPGAAGLPQLSGDWAFDTLGSRRLRALIFWGDYSYGTYDTRFIEHVELDERWLFALAKDPGGQKARCDMADLITGAVCYRVSTKLLII